MGFMGFIGFIRFIGFIGFIGFGYYSPQGRTIKLCCWFRSRPLTRGLSSYQVRPPKSAAGMLIFLPMLFLNEGVSGQCAYGLLQGYSRLSRRKVCQRWF